MVQVTSLQKIRRRHNVATTSRACPVDVGVGGREDGLLSTPKDVVRTSQIDVGSRRRHDVPTTFYTDVALDVVTTLMIGVD